MVRANTDLVLLGLLDPKGKIGGMNSWMKGGKDGQMEVIKGKR